MRYHIRDGQEGDQAGIAATIVEAFYDNLKSISRSKKVLIEVLAKAVTVQRFVVAVDKKTNLVVGTIGLGDQQGYPVRVEEEQLIKIFGYLEGKLARMQMEDEFYTPKHFSPDQGQIDFVAVKRRARGHHLATEMLQYILRTKVKYRQFTLDVIEGNEGVLPIYRSIGFKISQKIPEKNGANKGFNFCYRMQLQRAAS